MYSEDKKKRREVEIVNLGMKGIAVKKLVSVFVMFIIYA